MIDCESLIMIRLSQLSKEIYRPKDIAHFVGVTN